MTKRLFTLKLTLDLKNSEFTFGYIDTDFIRMPDEEHKFVGNDQGIVWLRMNEETEWKLKMRTFAMGPRGDPLGATQMQSMTLPDAIINTAQSFIYLPRTLFKEFSRMLKADNPRIGCGET
jgi:hypothetical protein